MEDCTTRRGPQTMAVMGGSFDPIHLGHLLIAERVREHLGLGSVLFIPCGRPPHKPGCDLAAAEHRFAMAVLATRDNPGFAVSRLELDRPGPSYALDTIRALRAQGGPEAEVTYILGADQALDLMTWHRAVEVVQESRFVVVPRPGSDLTQLPARLGPAAERATVLPLAELPISASDVRARVAAGRSIRYLVPESVREYILSHGLYRAGCGR
jgi:nicotinate-nucleotide adenylyltransferase